MEDSDENLAANVWEETLHDTCHHLPSITTGHLSSFAIYNYIYECAADMPPFNKLRLRNFPSTTFVRIQNEILFLKYKRHVYSISHDHHMT